MPHITVDDANAWVESTKLDLNELNTGLEGQIVTQVFAKFAGHFDVATWADEQTTPKLVKSIIAMYYVAWYYDRTYSDNSEVNTYAARLRRAADLAIEGILEGSQILEEEVLVLTIGKPSFFPNDLSSSQEPTPERPADGPAYFMMGTTF